MISAPTVRRIRPGEVGDFEPDHAVGAAVEVQQRLGRDLGDPGLHSVEGWIVVSIAEHRPVVAERSGEVGRAPQGVFGASRARGLDRSPVAGPIVLRRVDVDRSARAEPSPRSGRLAPRPTGDAALTRRRTGAMGASASTGRCVCAGGPSE